MILYSGINPFNLETLYNRAEENLTFLESQQDGATFKIPKKDIYLYVSTEGCSWYTKTETKEKPERIEFDNVLDQVDDKMKIRLLYHLDIFREEDVFDSYMKQYIFSECHTEYVASIPK